MKNVNKLFNQRFIQLRKHFNLSQLQMADILMIKRTTIGAIEEFRQNIPNRLIVEIFDLFDIPEDKLFSIMFIENYDFKSLLNKIKINYEYQK